MYEEPKQSQFNSGIALLERIDRLKRWGHEARVANKCSDWLEFLLAYRSEVWEFLSNPEREQLTSLVNAACEANSNNNNDRNFKAVYWACDRLLLQLNVFNSKYGLSMVSKDRTSDAADK